MNNCKLVSLFFPLSCSCSTTNWNVSVPGVLELTAATSPQAQALRWSKNFCIGCNMTTFLKPLTCPPCIITLHYYHRDVNLPD